MRHAFVWKTLFCGYARRMVTFWALVAMGSTAFAEMQMVMQAPKAQDQAFFQQTIDGVLSQAQKNGAGAQNLSFANGTSISLPRLQTELMKVRVLEGGLTTQSVDRTNVYCSDGIRSTWWTGQDAGDGVPTVAGGGSSDSNLSTDYPGQEKEFLLHEGLSSLGIVDDQYQVSGPLLLAAHGQPVPGEAFQNVETREHAPVFKLDGTESCLTPSTVAKKTVLNGLSVNLMNTSRVEANGTGVGGGGHPIALRIKMDLLIGAQDWWRKNAGASVGSKQLYLEFTRRLLAVGIENWPRYSEAMYPVNYVFKPSKRTQKCSIYLSLDMYELDLKEQNTLFSTTYNQALDVIYRKIYFRDILGLHSTSLLTILPEIRDEYFEVLDRVGSTPSHHERFTEATQDRCQVE